MKLKSYKQYDKRWAKDPYQVKGKETATIGGSGCGPTCAAMVASTYVDPKITPVEVCKWSVKHGYKAVGQGTYYTFFEAYFKSIGVDCQQVPGANSYHKKDTASDKLALKALKAGKLVIACMGPGIWTRGGHFILAHKYKDGKVHINDPASSAPGRQTNTWNNFQNEAKYYWIVTPPKGKNQKETKEAAKTTKKVAKKAAKAKTYKAKVTPKVGLNVRKGRGTKYARVKTLKQGTTVIVYETKGDWCKIHKTKNWFAHKKYLKKI